MCKREASCGQHKAVPGGASGLPGCCWGSLATISAPFSVALCKPSSARQPESLSTVWPDNSTLLPKTFQLFSISTGIKSRCSPICLTSSAGAGPTRVSELASGYSYGPLAPGSVCGALHCALPVPAELGPAPVPLHLLAPLVGWGSWPQVFKWLSLSFSLFRVSAPAPFPVTVCPSVVSTALY